MGSSLPPEFAHPAKSWQEADYRTRVLFTLFLELEAQVAAQALYSLIYVDETARLAASGFTSADVGRVAWQQSDNTFWELTDFSPITWVEVSGASAIPHHASLHLPGASDALTCGTPVDVGVANAEGGAAAFARSDHVHALPAVGTAGNSTLASIIVDAEGRVTAHSSGSGTTITAAEYALLQLGEPLLSGYREILPEADPFPTSIICWTDAGKTVKRWEQLLTYTGVLVTTEVTKFYYGGVLFMTITDTISYDGVFESSRTRVVT